MEKFDTGRKMQYLLITTNYVLGYTLALPSTRNGTTCDSQHYLRCAPDQANIDFIELSPELMANKESRRLLVEKKLEYDTAIKENRPFKEVRKILQAIRSLEKLIKQDQSSRDLTNDKR